MARLNAPILLETYHRSVHNTIIKEQILEADNLYLVLYKGKPFNLKSMREYSTPQYKPIASVNKATTVRLVNRLNKKFDTEDFTLWQFTDD